MSNLIVVGMAELKVAEAPDKLVTYGLGSCVGVTLYDPLRRIGGMVHVMLPDSSLYAGHNNKAKFMDTGIAELLNVMAAAGASKVGLRAKVAGGAHMFGLTHETDIIKVGLRNGEMAARILEKYRIPIMARELGGTFGRTIILDTADGSLQIRTVGHGEHTV